MVVAEGVHTQETQVVVVTLRRRRWLLLRAVTVKEVSLNKERQAAALVCFVHIYLSLFTESGNEVN